MPQVLCPKCSQGVTTKALDEQQALRCPRCNADFAAWVGVVCQNQNGRKDQTGALKRWRIEGVLPSGRRHLFELTGVPELYVRKGHKFSIIYKRRLLFGGYKAHAFQNHTLARSWLLI